MGKLTVEQAIAKARAEIGTKEYPQNSNNVKYNTKYYGREVSGSDYPWCCAFQWWIFEEYGMIPKTASCTYLMNWCKDNGRFGTVPKRGAWVFYNFNKNPDKNRATHIGLCSEIINDQYIKAVEGNTSTGEAGSQDNGGCVAERKRDISSVIGYGYPDYANEVEKVDFVDISKYNIITDWDALAKEVNGVVIRIGYRGYGNGSITIDNKFADHFNNARNRGLKIGFYFLSQAINANEAIEEADFIKNVLKDYKPDMPVFIDSEYSNNNHNGRADGLTKDQRTFITVKFCERIKQHGFIPGVYASESWFKNQLVFNSLSQYYIWCAKYSKTNTAPNLTKCDAWQYSSSIKYSWSTGYIDTNRYYKISPVNVIINTEPTVTQTYKTGQTYTLQANMFVRLSPAGNKKPFTQLTADGKKHAYSDENGYGILMKGTRVTCKGITVVGKQQWMKVPSGYICATSGEKIYVS